jgi:DNA invertase Pin-like site-specific DNA recombinase
MTTQTTLTVQAIGYSRVSTDEQTSSGAGLDAQAAKIAAVCAAKGFQLVGIQTDEGVSGAKAAADRPALSAVLTMLATGQASVLVVGKFDRLSRSVAHLSGLMDRAKAEGWQLVIADSDVDTTTSGGRLMANVLGSVAEWERAVIGERTRDALATRKAKGVRLGRPVQTDPAVTARVCQLKAEGLSLRAIVAQLTAENVPTTRGGKWYASTVRAVLASHELDAHAAMMGA